jgi:hypothetical protein
MFDVERLMRRKSHSLWWVICAGGLFTIWKPRAGSRILGGERKSFDPQISQIDAD